MPRKGPNDKPVQLSYGGDFSGSGKWVWASSLDGDGNPLPGFDAKRDALTQDEVNSEGLQNAGNAGNFFDDVGNFLGIVPKKIGNGAPGASVDTTQADQTRGEMDGLLAQLQQQAATGAGDWQNALKAATERTQQTASAVGQSNPNVDAGAALTNIGNAQAGASQRAAGQANVLRSQSQQAAQSQLGDLVGSMGRTDLEQSNAQARAKQQVAATNLSLIDQAEKRGNDLKSGIGQAIPLSDGGQVPGRAEVFGNDERNDTKPALLSPGEIVVDREHAQDPYSAARRAFEIAMQQQGGAPKMAEGGDIGNYTSDEYGSGNVALSIALPTIGQSAGYGKLRGMAGAGPASVQNGGKLDTKNFDASRANALGLASSLGGPRLSAAPQMTTNAADDAIGAALNNRGRANAANVSAGVGAMQQGAGGNAAAQAGNEQARAQGLQGNVLANQRGRDLSMAQAQQQAGWANTMSNLGISLANQAALRGLFSGAGQAATAASGAMGDSGGRAWDESGQPFGDTSPMQTNDLGFQGGDEIWDESTPDDRDTSGDTNDLPGFAKGGMVEGKYPRMPKPKDPSRVSLKLGDVTLSPHEETTVERGQRKWAEYEEETGDEPVSTKPAPKAKEKTIAERLSDFAQRATGSVSRMADGGKMSGSVTNYDPTAAFALPPQVVNSPAGVQMPPPGRPFVPPGFVATQNGLAPTAANETPFAFSSPPGADPWIGPNNPATAATANKYVEEQESAKRKSLGIMPPDGAAPPAPEPPPPTQAPRMGGGVAVPQPDAMGRAFVNNEAQLANEQMGEANAAAARAEVAGIEARELATQQANLRMQDAQARARANTDAAMARWQATQDEVNRIDTKVDPNRFWAEKTTGQKILGILGLALGAAGTGPDGINKAAQMMNQALDRDLQLQKDAVERRLKGGQQRLEGARTYYAMARENGMDELAAASAARGAMLDEAALRAAKLAASTKETIAKATMGQYAAALSQSALDEKEKAKQQTFSNRLQSEHLRIQAMAAGAKGVDKDSQKQLLEIGEREKEIQQSGKKLLGLIEKFGTQEKWGEGVEEQMNQAINGMIIASAKMQDREGVVRKDDEDRERRSLGFSPGFFQRSGNARTAIQSYIDNAQRRRDNALSVRGLR